MPMYRAASWLVSTSFVVNTTLSATCPASSCNVSFPISFCLYGLRPSGRVGKSAPLFASGVSGKQLALYVSSTETKGKVIGYSKQKITVLSHYLSQYRTLKH